MAYIGKQRLDRLEKTLAEIEQSMVSIRDILSELREDNAQLPDKLDAINARLAALEKQSKSSSTCINKGLQDISKDVQGIASQYDTINVALRILLMETLTKDI